MDWRLGTIGFGYQDWSGVFYPPNLPVKKYLGHYSRYFNAVEMNTTFYGPPRQDSVLRWAAVVPADFAICAKTPQIITHQLGLVNAGQHMQSFLEVMRLAGDKLGVILIQLPPSFDLRRLTVLGEFLSHLPGDLRFAVEFRSQSWYTPTGSPQPEAEQLLRENGIGWAATEYPGLPIALTPGTDFLYIRWIGRHGMYRRHDRERVDKTPQLEHWRALIQGQPAEVQTVYGFFNNDYAGFGAATCNRFKQLIGLPARSLKPPQQRALF